MFNTTFSNISAILWRPILVEEAGENRRTWASNWQTLSLATGSRVPPFRHLQSGAWTHAVLVMGLYELLSNPNYLTQWATRVLNKIFKCLILIWLRCCYIYNQTCPCGHLLLNVTFSCSVIENFIWIEPLLRDHLSYKDTFSLFQKMTT